MANTTATATASIQPPSLYRRINAVKGELTRLAKSGKNTHFNFKFATESDVSDALRPLMDKHGVCLLYHGIAPEAILIEEAGETKGGSITYRYKVRIQYELVNVDNPAERETVWGYGEALDQQDKGHTKAITNAHKYVMMKVFDVSAGDDHDDPDSHVQDNFRGKAKTAPIVPPSQSAAVLQTTSGPATIARASSLPAPVIPNKLLGQAGADMVYKRLGERGMALFELRQEMYKRNLKNVLKGIEHEPEKWPAGLGEDLAAIFKGIRELPKPEEGLPDEENAWRELRREASAAWNRGMRSRDAEEGMPKTPLDMVSLMTTMSDWQQFPDGAERYREMTKQLKAGAVLLPEGAFLPM